MPDISLNISIKAARELARALGDQHDAAMEDRDRGPEDLRLAANLLELALLLHAHIDQSLAPSGNILVKIDGSQVDLTINATPRMLDGFGQDVLCALAKELNRELHRAYRRDGAR